MKLPTCGISNVTWRLAVLGLSYLLSAPSLVAQRTDLRDAALASGIPAVSADMRRPSLKQGDVTASRPCPAWGCGGAHPLPALSLADEALRKRALPPGFPHLPIMPVVVNGPGDVLVTPSVLAAFQARYGISNASAYVRVSTAGSDDTGQVNSDTQPYRTISAALKKTSAPRILVDAGTYDPPDFRHSDAHGDVSRWVQCIKAAACTLRVTGDDIGKLAWTETETPHIYRATIASDGITSGKVNEVLLRDGSADPYGFPARLPAAYPNQWLAGTQYSAGQYVWMGKTTAIYVALKANKNQAPPAADCWMAVDADTAGLANLKLLASGQYYSTATKTLFVKLGGADLTQPSVAARLRATYFARGNNNPRVFAYGTTLALSGFYLDGVGVEATEYFDGSAYTPSEVWLQDNVVFASPFHGHYVLGSSLFAQNVRCHANFYDCFNSQWSNGGIHPALMVEASVYATESGDPAVYNSPGLPGVFPNRNGSSSHSGYVASFGSIYEGSMGPEIADTSSTVAGIPSVSWYVGVVARNVNPANAANVSGFQMSGIAGSVAEDRRNRVFYLDSCSSRKEGSYELFVEQNAAGRVYRPYFDQPVAYYRAPSVSAYAPDNPAR